MIALLKFGPYVPLREHAEKKGALKGAARPRAPMSLRVKAKPISPSAARGAPRVRERRSSRIEEGLNRSRFPFIQTLGLAPM